MIVSYKDGDTKRFARTGQTRRGWQRVANIAGRKLDMLKSDTQGYEWQLISGARKTILHDKPVILCEVAPKALAAIGDSHEELLRFFEEAGYSMLMVDRHIERLKPIGYAELKRHFDETSREFEDVIFLPPETA